MLLLAAVGLLTACEQSAADSEGADTSMEEQTTDTADMDWIKKANIYEVNIRQYTPEGTFNAFAQHLPRLQDMGVKILWFMPIYPISEKNRKGTLGSYYAVSDFTSVNPNFGTMDDFKALVADAHTRGMKVILDWVPNHTGWDHHWITEHPDWYTQNEAGEIIDPSNDKGESYGWTDVADLNYNNADMRKAMIDDLKFWLTEVGVDGYRCDVAYEVPDDFWAQVHDAFKPFEPVFMLAEAEHAPHRNEGYFNMSYSWSFHHLMNDIAKGKKDATAVKTWYQEDRAKFKQGYHMQFTTNHDENSWNGTIEERMGEAGDAMNVLAFTFDGMPLIYSGQEAGLNKRLEFFE
ncbi:MAG: alpha-amylase, partial [Phaeodactylibacter sp.]|nr:alpha-amylase [Phaeodactylibacter sp.]